MLVYQQKEFLIFVLRSFICGIFLGGIYDVFRIFRIFFKISERPFVTADRLYRKSYPLIGKLSGGTMKSKTAGNFLLFLSDVLFSVVAAIAVVLVAFFENDGKIRVECLAVTAIGFLLYYISIGKLTMAFSSYLTFAIRISAAYLRFLLMLPIKLAFGMLKKAFMRMYVFLITRIRAYIILKESKKYTSYVLALSRRAFLDDTSHKTMKGKVKTYGAEKKI